MSAGEPSRDSCIGATVLEAALPRTTSLLSRKALVVDIVDISPDGVPETRRTSQHRRDAATPQTPRRPTRSGGEGQGLHSPLRHVSRKPWSARCGRLGRGFGLSDLGRPQACDLGFCGVSEACTCRKPSMDRTERKAWSAACRAGGVSFASGFANGATRSLGLGAWSIGSSLAVRRLASAVLAPLVTASAEPADYLDVGTGAGEVGELTDSGGLVMLTSVRWPWLLTLAWELAGSSGIAWASPTLNSAAAVRAFLAWSMNRQRGRSRPVSCDTPAPPQRCARQRLRSLAFSRR